MAGNAADTVTALPDHVDIGPHRYTIVCDEAAIDKAGRESQAELLGHCEHRTTTIILRPDQSASMLADSVLHEVLHAITSVTGIANDLGHDDDEAMVNRLSPALLDALQRNPTLTAYLTGDST